MEALTKSQVNKAGRTLRSPWNSLDEASLDRALDVLLRYRAANQLPLVKANMGLRSVVNTEGCKKIEVSQRLKRVPTILDKLRRQPTMQLSTMQDIGGCRAVLADTDELRRVQRRLKRNRPPIRERDYIRDPRSSGYRGVHVVVGYEERSGK